MPLFYHKDLHKISKDKIDNIALLVIFTLKKCGHSTYLVGGSVRDLLRNVPPKDFDVGTTARPFDVKRIFKHSIIVGRRFPIVHVRIGKKIVEVATFRKGGNASSALIKRDVLWGTPEDDALRRDFTINALFYDPEDEVILDYVGGFRDVKNGVLRVIGKPENRFKQDPVRMIRLFKFESRGFCIDKQSRAAIETCKEHICNSAGARILDQLFIAATSPGAFKFYKSLAASGLLRSLFTCCDVSKEQEENLWVMVESLQKHNNKTITRHLVVALVAIILYGHDNLLNINKKVLTYHSFANFLMKKSAGSIISISKKVIKSAYDMIVIYRVLAFCKCSGKNPVFSWKHRQFLEDAKSMMKVGSSIFPKMAESFTHIKFIMQKNVGELSQ